MNNIMTTIEVIGRRKIFLGIAALLVGASIITILGLGFERGIDMSGGVMLKFIIRDEIPLTSAIQEVFRKDLGLEEVRISYDPSTGIFSVRYPQKEEVDHAKVAAVLSAKYPAWEELSYQTTSPSVGKDLRRRSWWAIGTALTAVSLYIAFAFRKVYRPVSSWKYGIVTMITLFHDVVIPAGLLALLGKYRGVEIDASFVVALLVIMGFSVHDTIVVFDRIRENLLLDRGKSNFGKLINDSVNQTMARSINTSLTLILVLLTLYFAGPLTLKYFILTLLVGVTAGVYSSIFVASPLLYLWSRAGSGSGGKEG